MRIRYWSLVALAILVICGGAARIYQLGHDPYWMDEGYTILGIKELNLPIDETLEHAQHYTCTAYCVPSAYIARVYGDNPISYRALSVVAGTGLIVVIYLLATLFAGRTVGLLSAALVATSYFEIAWSRQARWYTLFSFFFWLAILFYWRALSETSRFRTWTTLAAVATFLAGFTHTLGFLLPIIFIGYSVWEHRTRILKSALLPWITIGGLVPLALLELIHPFVPLEGLQLHFTLPLYAQYYALHYWPLLLCAGYAIWNIEMHRRAKLFLAVLAAAYILPIVILSDLVHYRYLFHLLPALFILAALGFAELFARITLPYRTLLLIASLIVYFGLGFGVIVPQTSYFLESDDPGVLDDRPYYAYTPQPDWNSAYAYIAERLKPEDVVIATQPQLTYIFLQQPGYWLPYDYLGGNAPTATTTESYVGARVIADNAALQKIIATKHGYIVFDFMARDGRLMSDQYATILTKTKQVFYSYTNYYSQVWVYQF